MVDRKNSDQFGTTTRKQKKHDHSIAKLEQNDKCLCVRARTRDKTVDCYCLFACYIQPTILFRSFC